jgi:hypothetical protein
MFAFVVVHRLINSLDESCDSTNISQVTCGPTLCCSWPKIPIPAAPPSANRLEFSATKDGDLIPPSRATPGHFHIVIDRRPKTNCWHALAPWIIDTESRRHLHGTQTTHAKPSLDSMHTQLPEPWRWYVSPCIGPCLAIRQS